MTTKPGPLVVQSDKTLLLEIDHERAAAARAAIAPFAVAKAAVESGVAPATDLAALKACLASRNAARG